MAGADSAHPGCENPCNMPKHPLSSTVAAIPCLFSVSGPSVTNLERNAVSELYGCQQACTVLSLV